MRAEEVREMSPADIKARVAELEEERFRLRFRSATEALSNPMVLRTIRKDIARLKTVLTEKERGIEKTAAKKEVKRASKKGSANARKRVKNG